MIEVVTCNQCLEEFEPKRSDQKFCSLKCKNKHNNKKVKALYRQRKQEAVYSYDTNVILNHNRNLLEANSGKEVQVKALQKMGFKLNKITGFEQLENKSSPLLFCYDYGYQFVDEGVVKIFKRQ